MVVSIICLILNLIAGYWIWFRVGKQKAIDSMAKDLMRAAQQIERYALLVENYKQELYELRLENERLEDENEEKEVFPVSTSQKAQA